MIEYLYKEGEKACSKEPSTFEEFCNDIKVYNLKYKWQRFIPKFILYKFIKPTTFKNCHITGLSNLDFGKENDIYTQTITINYSEIK